MRLWSKTFYSHQHPNLDRQQGLGCQLFLHKVQYSEGGQGTHFPHKTLLILIPLVFLVPGLKEHQSNTLRQIGRIHHLRHPFRKVYRLLERGPTVPCHHSTHPFRVACQDVHTLKYYHLSFLVYLPTTKAFCLGFP